MCDSKAFYSTAYFVLRIILICLFCSGSYAKKPPVAISAEGQKDEQEHVSDVNMSEPVDTCYSPRCGTLFIGKLCLAIGNLKVSQQ